MKDRLTYDIWVKKFDIQKDEAGEPKMYDTTGDSFTEAIEQCWVPSGRRWQRLWSLIEERGHLVLKPGYQHQHCIGHFIGKRSWGRSRKQYKYE